MPTIIWAYWKNDANRVALHLQCVKKAISASTIKRSALKQGMFVLQFFRHNKKLLWLC